MSIGKRISEARQAKGWSQSELARAIGVSQPTIYKLEEGQTENSRHLLKIAKALDVSADWLLSGEGTHPAIADAVQKAGEQVAWIMSLGWASAGEWVHIAHNPSINAMTYWKDVSFPRIPVPKDVCPHERCYALEVTGRSMINPNIGEKTFLPGEKIIVDPLKDPKDGDFVIACKKEDDNKYQTIFKQYIIEQDGKRLKPLNPKGYKDTIVDDTVEIVGVVVGKVDYKI